MVGSEADLVVGRALAPDSKEAGQTALAAGTSRAVVEETETRSEEVQGVLVDTTDPARVPTAAAVLQAWGREAEASAVEVVGAVGGDNKHLWRYRQEHGHDANECKANSYALPLGKTYCVYILVFECAYNRIRPTNRQASCSGHHGRKRQDV